MSDLIPAFQSFADLAAARLWQGSLIGGASLGVVWGITRLATSLSPRIACWLWRLACLKLLVALLWIQPVFLRVLPPAEPRVAGLTGAAVASSPALPAAAAAAVEDDWTPVTRMAHEVSGSWSWLDSVIAAWLLGAVAVIALTGRQWMSARRLVRSSRAVADPAMLAVFQELAGELRIGALPGLRTSDDTQSPLLIGIWRPLVILPAHVERQFGDAERRLMLAHELAHLARRDLAWNWLLTIASWLFYFHPGVWLARRGWSESQESACDELLIQTRLTRPAEYGRLLLKVATSWAQPTGANLLAAGVLGAYRVIEKRILTMNRVKPDNHRRLRTAACVLALVGVTGLVPWKVVARESAAAAETDSKAESKASALPGRIYAPAVFETEAGEVSALISIDPNTGEWEKIGPYMHGQRVSPDGKLMVGQTGVDGQQKTILLDLNARSTKDLPLQTTDISKLSGPNPDMTESVVRPLWSPDGKFVLYNSGTMGIGKESRGWRGVAFLLDLKTNGKQPLGLPETDEVDDWSPKGNWLATVSDRHPPFGSGYQIYVMHPDGTDERRLTEGRGLNCYPRFHPDGTKLAYLHQERGKNSIFAIDVTGENRRLVVEGKGEQGEPGGVCWSPQGDLLAVVKTNYETKENSFVRGSRRIEIVALDGESRGELKLKGVTKMEFLGDLEWR